MIRNIVVIFLVITMLCCSGIALAGGGGLHYNNPNNPAVSSGGSGYQEPDRSGWLQSAPDAGFKLREIPKEPEPGVIGIQPFPYADYSLLEKCQPWSGVLLTLLLSFSIFLLVSSMIYVVRRIRSAIRH